MAPGFGSADLFRMFGSFALVLALMAALLWALRRLQSRMNSQNAGRRLQILESVSVGPRQKNCLGSRWRTRGHGGHHSLSNLSLGPMV